MYHTNLQGTILTKDGRMLCLLYGLPEHITNGFLLPILSDKYPPNIDLEKQKF